MFIKIIQFLALLQLLPVSAKVEINAKAFSIDIHSKIVSPKYQSEETIRSMILTDTSAVQTIYSLQLLFSGPNCQDVPVTFIGQVSDSTGLLIPGCFETQGGFYQSISISYSVGELPPYPYYAIGSSPYTLIK